MVGVNYGDAINPVEGIPKRYVLIGMKFRSFRLENEERSFSRDNGSTRFYPRRIRSMAVARVLSVGY